MNKYEPIAHPRFHIALDERGETIVTKARKSIFPLLFLPVWLAGWTAGGIAAIAQLSRQFEPFLILWLCGWATGWIFAAGSIAWMLAGRQALRVIGGDLEVGIGLPGIERRRLYEGKRIAHLGVSSQDSIFNRLRFPAPPLFGYQAGAVKFNYGPRTIYVADGLDEAEGAMIVERLLQRLPKGAG